MQVRPSSEPHPGLTGARAARAARPRPQGEALRTAYLELLKLCLCDLVGASTTSVGRMQDGVVASRELTGHQRRLRAAGMDWPLHGLTMVGLRRLDDLQSCVEAVMRVGVAGDLIEAGAWRGGASILMRATLDSLGDDDRTVWVADSFQGFPTPDEPDDQWGVIDYLGVPLDEVRGNFERLGYERGVTFLPGFFEDTLPGLRDRTWALVRLDGDTYDATRLTLECLYPSLSVGGYLVVDDYGALEECRRAVDEFRAEHGIAEPLEEVDWTCVRWRRESDTVIEVAAPEASKRSDGRVASGAMPGAGDARVPTSHELELAAEAATLRERLERAEAEIARLQGSRLRGVKARARRALRRGR